MKALIVALLLTMSHSASATEACLAYATIGPAELTLYKVSIYADKVTGIAYTPNVETGDIFVSGSIHGDMIHLNAFTIDGKPVGTPIYASMSDNLYEISCDDVHNNQGDNT